MTVNDLLEEAMRSFQTYIERLPIMLSIEMKPEVFLHVGSSKIFFQQCSSMFELYQYKFEVQIVRTCSDMYNPPPHFPWILAALNVSAIWQN